MTWFGSTWIPGGGETAIQFLLRRLQSGVAPPRSIQDLPAIEFAAFVFLATQASALSGFGSERRQTQINDCFDLAEQFFKTCEERHKTAKAPKLISDVARTLLAYRAFDLHTRFQGVSLPGVPKDADRSIPGVQWTAANDSFRVWLGYFPNREIAYWTDAEPAFVQVVQDWAKYWAISRLDELPEPSP